LKIDSTKYGKILLYSVGLFNFAYQKEQVNFYQMQTALLIIDIQNDYFENGTMALVGAEEASLNAKEILYKFRSEKSPIIHVQHIATRPTATFFLPGTGGAEIQKNVTPDTGELLVVKHFPNSFKETNLLDYLKTNNITDLVICGMMTHMCIDATVRAAKDMGFNVTLVADACATRDLDFEGSTVPAKQVHNSFLAALKNTYATIVTTKQLTNNQ